MDNMNLYEKLASHLHQGIIGAPMSPSLIGILEIMFSQEEAEIACKLPFDNKSLQQLKKMFPDKSESLETILTGMAKNGTVFTQQKPEKDRVYRLLPTVVGFAEAPYWGGMDTQKARKLAPLWIKYRDEGFGKELARNIPTVRVIPIDQSLKNKSEILPFDHLKEKISTHSYFSVSNCPCRQMMLMKEKDAVILWKTACISETWRVTWWSRGWEERSPKKRPSIFWIQRTKKDWSIPAKTWTVIYP
jgi:hypothetical protein